MYNLSHGAESNMRNIFRNENKIWETTKMFSILTEAAIQLALP